MFLDKYKTPNHLKLFKYENSYTNHSGERFHHPIKLIQVGFLNFCGCGQPRENIEYILGGLELIDSYLKTDNGWSESEEKRKAHFGNKKAENFFYYWAHKQELTDHDDFIPGWLTEKGHEMVGVMREALECPDEDE